MSGEAQFDTDDRPTADELEELPVLDQGQADDLHADNGKGVRFWLSRCGIEDGEPFARTVTIEVRDDRGRWANLLQYNGDDPTEEIAP